MAAGPGDEDDAEGETDEDTEADEASILQPSTAFTSTTAVDRYDSDESSDGSYHDAHVICTRCDNPQDYCHCAPMRIPPRINNEEEDDDITEEAMDDEGRAPPVAVIYGPTAEEGYAMRGLPSYAEARDPSPINTRRANAPRRPIRTLSPTPSGFVLNNGMNWVPMVIEHEGRRIPARYVRVRMLRQPGGLRDDGAALANLPRGHTRRAMPRHGARS